MKKVYGWLLLPVIILFVLRDRWNCSRGNHSGLDPSGYCGRCGNKVRRGRGDPEIPEGCLYIWGEE